MRTLVIGDIHSRLDSLKGVLKLSNYNPESDRIICIGDYIDGGKYAYEVADYLLELDENSRRENIFLLGNHDYTFLNILEDGMDKFRDRERIEEVHWEFYNNGGMATYDSYISKSDEEIIHHREQFFKKLKYYHVEDNKLFVHAGYDFNDTIENCYREDKNQLLWDRHLYKSSINDHSDSSSKTKFGPWDTIFIGHTPTFLYGDDTPRRRCNVVAIDQGCKVNGKLSAWILETDKWYQYVPKKNR